MARRSRFTVRTGRATNAISRPGMCHHGPFGRKSLRATLGLVSHMPRYAGVVVHMPHTRPAIRAREAGGPDTPEKVAKDLRSHPAGPARWPGGPRRSRSPG